MNKNKLSVTNLLCALINKAEINDIKISPTNDTKKLSMTLRVEPEIKQFYEIQADNLGVSLHDFITMTLRSVMHSTLPQVNTEIDLCIERFLEVFKIHSIPTVDIPRFIPGCNILLSDLKNPDSLLPKMTEEVFEQTSKLFSVNLKWLKGVADNIYERYNRHYDSLWYKNPEQLIERLNHHRLKGKIVEVLILTTTETTDQIKSSSYKDYNENDSALLPINITLKVTDNKLRYTYYERFNTEAWNYTPVREVLISLLTYFNKSRITYWNLSLSEKAFSKFNKLNIFLSDIIRSNGDNRLISFQDFCEETPDNPELKTLRNAGFIFEERLKNYIPTNAQM
ncbi:MAG TPA: hypothetical protein DD412_03440 [Holosporales bacterium]|nr:hypothetical protein [Holosporales bacterium]